MCLTQFFSGAHNVLIDEIKNNRYVILDQFIELQKIGEYAYRKQGYQKLYKEMDAANAAMEYLDYGQLSRMPLEWRDHHTTYWKDMMLGIYLVLNLLPQLQEVKGNPMLLD